MKKKLRALEEFFYDGKTRKVGDVFEAVDPDANILTVTKKVVDVSGPVIAAKPAAPKLRTADVKAEETSKPMTTENTEELAQDTRRRRYMRRDMTAKE